MKEFDVIRELLAPLSKQAGAEGLRDDVSLLPSRTDARIITTDTLVEGVHFFASDPLDTVAKKLVRVNVSDCLAKGAKPKDALLNLTWPKKRSDDDLRLFVSGLAEDFAQFEIDLIGGDTTSTNGQMVLSLTLIGACVGLGPTRRRGARENDDIWVSGTIGDARLGLECLIQSLADQPDLVARYRVPDVPIPDIADCIARYATASIDVSDGLVADLRHLAEAANLKAEILADHVPLSDETRKITDADLSNLTFSDLVTGGDDYQALFTASPNARDALEAWSRKSGQRLSRIGCFVKGEGVDVLNANGDPLKILTPGWQHGSDF